MTSQKLREKFLKFFKERGHRIVPSSSLIPEDKTVLLTSAGMQQFIPYLSGQKDVLTDFKTRHLISVQKCFRTLDIEEVGDDTHHTFFEMLGNWSIGQDPEKGYFKQGAIKLALDFFIEEIGLDKNKFWITIFKGENKIPRDEEALKIWQENGIPKQRIKEFGLEDNFWGPTAETGPCGPCSEIHYDRGEQYGCKDSSCGPNCKECNRFVELWNLVFMEYERKIKNQKSRHYQILVRGQAKVKMTNQNLKIIDYKYVKLPQRNVDTGIGFERLLALLENKNSGYETDLFEGIIKKLEKISNRKYEENKGEFRIIADHIRGAVFLISDSISPSNVESGYILRRILRRAIRYGKVLNLEKEFLIPLVKEIVKIYQGAYPEIKSNENDILAVISREEEKFEKTLNQGLKQLEKLIAKNKEIKGEEAFYLYETYGFPLELTREIAGEKGIKVAEKDFDKALKKHQEISRAGAKAKFGGIGSQADYQAVKLHTATHLLHQALRQVLGKEVKQMGSDITAQRLRFDFSHNQKMTEQEIKQVEEIVNSKIKHDLEVKKEEMSYKKAVDSGALAFFKEKYPEKVSVYSIANFSKEICAGPHVKRTSELGRFKIIKEESSSAGIRRIKAVLE